MLYQEEYVIDVEFLDNIVESFTEAIKTSVFECQNIARNYLQENNLELLDLQEEELERLRRVQTKEIIELVEFSKKSIFMNVLDTYNEFLREGVDIKIFLKEANETSKEMIEEASYNIKKTGIIVVATILILPNIAPIIVGINIPRFGLNYLYQKKHQKQIETNNKTLEDYDRIQKDFFKLTDYLRTDYHRSNKKIKELKERALQGEDVIEEALLLLESSLIKTEEDKDIKQYSK